MFCIWKFFLDIGMNTFRNGMGFPERFISIDADFQINIYFISEHTGMEQVYTLSLIHI